MRSGSGNRGATLVEYALGLAILSVVFVAAAAYLRVAGEKRGNQSLEMQEKSVPCKSGVLSGACIVGQPCEPCM